MTSPYLVTPGNRFTLREINPDDTGGWSDKHAAKAALKLVRDRIESLQERLFAEHKQSLLIVLQATDTGGKDGTIKDVFRGVNPQGVRVHGFRQPGPEDLDHDFLWRIHPHTPAKGMITVFNRSHYEDVLVVRVRNLVPEEVWSRRYEAINEFEEMLVENGTRVLKFFLHISKDEQKERLQARLDDPEKHWKFNTGDLADRELWDDFQRAYEDAIVKCSTGAAPWYVIPSNHKWARSIIIAEIIEQTLREMDPQFPEPEAGLDQVVIV